MFTFICSIWLLKCIEIILKTIMNLLNYKNNVGNTALHIAAYIGQSYKLLKYPISYPEPWNNSRPYVKK